MDYEVKTSFNKSEKHWDVTVCGEIDIFNSNDFKEKLMELTKQNEADIYIRCENLSYIDSTGLGTLVAVLKTVKLYGGEIRLIKTKNAVSKLFRITNLDKAFVLESDGIGDGTGDAANAETKGAEIKDGETENAETGDEVE